MRIAHRKSAGLLQSLAFLLCVAAPDPAGAEWRRVDSPNFVVVGEVGTRELRDMAVKFEGFRETLSRVLIEGATATPVPTVVIVFSSDRAFTPVKPRYNGKPIEAAGYFMPRQDANYIAIVADGRQDRLNIVFHEYAHLITSNTARNVPTWLSEGLAEYYSTFEVTKGGQQALLGRPVGEHLDLLREARLLSLDELLNVDSRSSLYNEGNRRSIFYAQSWALTHLILLGQPTRTKALLAYLTSVAEGTPRWRRGKPRSDRTWNRSCGTTCGETYSERFNIRFQTSWPSSMLRRRCCRPRMLTRFLLTSCSSKGAMTKWPSVLPKDRNWIRRMPALP
jgi:hypothetical protein